MKRALVVVFMSVGLVIASPGNTVAAPLPSAPYISCPGGYIAKTGSECPPFHTPISVHPGQRGGGGGNPNGGGGLLGTIGRIVGGLLP